MSASGSQLPVSASDVVRFGSKSEQRAAVDALRLRLAAMAARTGASEAASGPVEGAPVATVELKGDFTAPADLSAGPVRTATGELTPGPTTESTASGGQHRRGSPRHSVGGRETGGHPEDELGDPETVAKNICLRLLTDSARPRANILAALMKRGIADNVANKVLDRFTELGLIDDDAYAQAYVRTKHKERGLGRRALALELRRKGIDDSIAIEAAHEVSTEDEWDRGRLLISKRLNSAMAAGPEAARRRLVGLLARRGYSASMSYDLVNSALRDYGVAEVDPPDLDGTL